MTVHARALPQVLVQSARRAPCPAGGASSYTVLIDSGLAESVTRKAYSTALGCVYFVVGGIWLCAAEVYSRYQEEE
jgi:hypothetical protein